MEVNNSTMVIMTKNGEFKKVKKPNYAVQIGMEYTVTKDKKDYSIMDLFSRRLAVAILTIVLILPGTFGYAYFKPAGYVNVDINPSLEITINMFNRVIDVKALNTDGEIVKGSGLKINNDKLVDGIESIVEKAEELGYIKTEKESHILITVTDSKKAEEEVKSIKEDLKDKGYITISILSADNEEHEEASSKGISTAEIILDKMIESDEELDDDIVKSISKFKKLEKKLEEKEKDKKDKEEIKESDDKDSSDESSDDEMEKDAKDKDEKDKDEKDKKNKDDSNEGDTEEIKDKSKNNTDSNNSVNKDVEKSQPSNNKTEDKSSTKNNDKNILDIKKDNSNVEKSSNTNNSSDKKNQDEFSEKINSGNSEGQEEKKEPEITEESKDDSKKESSDDSEKDDSKKDKSSNQKNDDKSAIEEQSQTADIDLEDSNSSNKADTSKDSDKAEKKNDNNDGAKKDIEGSKDDKSQSGKKEK